jgi:hypothetical protein
VSAPDFKGVREALYGLLAGLDSVRDAEAYEGSSQAKPDGYPLATIWLSALALTGGNAPFSQSEWLATYTARFTYRIDALGKDVKSQQVFDTLLGEFIHAIVIDQRLEAYDSTLNSATTRIEGARVGDAQASVISDDNGQPVAVQWEVPVDFTLTVNTGV